jgi:hypothetical protein
VPISDFRGIGIVFLIEYFGVKEVIIMGDRRDDDVAKGIIAYCAMNNIPILEI